jgi:vacuolar-type H+-ATPase subunit I/STV1
LASIGVGFRPARWAAKERRNTEGRSKCEVQDASSLQLLLLLTVGVINIIYGIGAVAGANAFENDTRFLVTNVDTLGWLLIILGVVQLTAGFSLASGNVYGRVMGIIAGTVGAIGALLSIGGNYPWWSLGVFALCVYVVYGIIVFGEDERASGGAGTRPPA